MQIARQFCARLIPELPPICNVRLFAQGVQLKMRAALPGASISIVSEPRAVATGSYAQLSINSYFVSYCLIRSLPLAVLTRFVATLTFNYTLSDTGGRDFLAYGV